MLVTSCGSNSGLESNGSKFLTVGMRWEPRTFNPFRSVDSASYFAQSLVFSGLVRYNQLDKIEGDLASSFEIDDSNTVYKFHLRKNIFFSDGSPIKASDVVASIREAAGKKSPFRKNYRLLDSIESNSNTVQVNFTGPDASLLSRFVDLKILPEKVLALDKSERSKFDRKPISSGPYRVLSWTPGQNLIFGKNQYYWHSKAVVDKLAWKVIPDKKLIAMALIRKEIDIASVGGREAKQLIKSAPHLNVASARGSRVVFIGFNTKKKPFDDARIRQALCMVVDRKKIKDTLYASYAQIPDSEFYQSVSKEGQTKIIWPYDLSRAKELFKEVGYSSGRDGLTSNGKSIALKIATVKDFVDLGQVLVSSFKRFGIKAEIEVLDYATLKDQYLKEGRFDLVLFSRSIGPVPDPRMFWSKEGNLNYSRFSRPDLDKLIEEGSNVSSLEEKKAINEQVGKILANEVPWIYLARPNLLVAHNQRVSNVIGGDQKTNGIPWNNFLLNAKSWKLEDQRIKD